MMQRDDINKIRDLLNEFFTDQSITVEKAQADFVDLIKNAAK